MSGLGSWHGGAYHAGMLVQGPRTAAGIHAFKQELVYNGAPGADAIDLSVNKFGQAMLDAVEAFQRDASIPADGIIGPQTARELFRRRALEQETEKDIPAHLLCRQKTLESNNDPVAQGWVDLDDEGLMQFNLRLNPDVSREEAWDPAYCIPAAARRLLIGKQYTGSWKGAAAAYNIGSYYARAWAKANYPATGGPVMGKDAHGQTIYAFTRATNYYAAVTAAPC